MCLWVDQGAHTRILLSEFVEESFVSPGLYEISTNAAGTIDNEYLLDPENLADR